MFNIAKARLSMLQAFEDSKKWFISRELPNGLFEWQGHAHGTYMPEMIGIAGLINEFLLQSVQNIRTVVWHQQQLKVLPINNFSFLVPGKPSMLMVRKRPSIQMDLYLLMLSQVRYSNSQKQTIRKRNNTYCYGTN